LTGDWDAVVAFLGGKIYTKSSLVVPKGDLAIILGEKPFIHDHVVSEELVFLYYSHDLDLLDYPDYFNFDTYLEENRWDRGLTTEYTFKLREDCKEAAFCTTLRNIGGSDRFTLTGADKYNTLLLKTDPFESTFAVQAIKFDDIRLVIDINFDRTPVFDCYIAFKNTIDVDEPEPYVLDGKITFNGDEGNYVANTEHSWTEAMGLDFLRINSLHLKGHIEPGSTQIKDIKANGLLIWGRNCFIVEPGKADFLENQCFYGMGDILPNLANFDKSYVIGSYQGITTHQLLYSLLDMNDEEIYDKVTNYFLRLRFSDFVQVLYVPPKEEQVSLLELSSPYKNYPAGLTVKGQSTWLGIDGLATLNLNAKKKNIYGVFHMPSTPIGNYNFLLKETDPLKSNNVVFRIEDNPLNEQVALSADIQLMGLNGNATFLFTKKDICVKGIINSNIFNQINIEGFTNNIQNLEFAIFDIKGDVPVDT